MYNCPSTISASMPSGNPTVPIRCSPCNGLVKQWLSASVIPNASITGTPNAFNAAKSAYLPAQLTAIIALVFLLTNLPTLFSGNYQDLTDKPVLFSGSYTDLTNTPTLFDGNYNSLSKKGIDVEELINNNLKILKDNYPLKKILQTLVIQLTFLEIDIQNQPQKTQDFYNQFLSLINKKSQKYKSKPKFEELLNF